MRYAIIKDMRKSDSVETVKAYLPNNFTVAHVDDNGAILIIGNDDHGWTLDGYVIPRLASALITAQEVRLAFIGDNPNYPVRMDAPSGWLRLSRIIRDSSYLYRLGATDER
jgi:hypothetical protein